MADDKTFSQADIDAAIEKAVGPLKESVSKLETKNDELIGENRRLKRGGDIKPEDLHAAEERADKAEARVKELEGSVKTLTKERDTAKLALETEQGAARSYALDAEIASAIAAGNVIPALVPAFTAMLKSQAKAELVDGKYVVKVADKAAKDHVAEFLGTEEGKHFKAATINGGGGAGGGGQKPGATTMTRSAYDALSQDQQGELGPKMAKGELTLTDG